LLANHYIVDEAGVRYVRPYTTFYRHSAVTLALDNFVSEISLVLYRKCHFVTFAHTPSSFAQNLKMFARQTERPTHGPTDHATRSVMRSKMGHVTLDHAHLGLFVVLSIGVFTIGPLGPCPLCWDQFLVHGQVTIIFVVSVCLFVCLFVCLSVCAQFFTARPMLALQALY